MVSICPVCRKEFEILHPPLWRYKINNEYVCSWGCLRKGEDKGVETTKREVPQTAKDEAVRIAIEGGDPIEYLGKYSVNPRGMWTYIRSVLKDKDPETFAKIPNLRMQPPKKALRKEEAPKKALRKETPPRKPRKVKQGELQCEAAPIRTTPKLDVNYLDKMAREVVENDTGPEPDVRILRVASKRTGIEYYLDEQDRMVMENSGEKFGVIIENMPDFLNELPPICRHLGVKV